VNMIGACGDNCSFCPRYIATQNRNATDLEKVKELWVRLGLRHATFPARDLACLGCKPNDKCAYSELRACAHEKGIDNCGLCDAYPCKLINKAFERSEELRSHAAHVCRPEEMDTLHKAFFSKKRNLDQIHNDMNQGRKGDKTANKRQHRIAGRSGSR
jgi:hypothetical protein